ncbi:hypothetical protein BSKO_03639 [Bryopsis sp. KO-2023]|nr:hypothetical protein BSKO_03639 [Bryopsis sp. KO-2023]
MLSQLLDPCDEKNLVVPLQPLLVHLGVSIAPTLFMVHGRRISLKIGHPQSPSLEFGRQLVQLLDQLLNRSSVVLPLLLVRLSIVPHVWWRLHWRALIVLEARTYGV